MSEIVKGIENIFDQQHKLIGYADPVHTAHVIGEKFAISAPEVVDNIAAVIRSYPTKEFLYPGVIDTVDALLQEGDHISIWTDDFLDRVLSSGLWNYRLHTIEERRRRLRLISGINKHEALATKVIPSLREGAFSHVVFVDDKDKNLNEAKSLITQLDLQIPANFVRIEWGGKMDRESSDDESNVIFDIKDLLKVRQRFAQERDGQIKWLIDFNDALLDRNAYIDTRCMRIEGHIQGRIAGF